MKQKLSIRINFNKETDIDTSRIKLELLKMWVKSEIKVNNKFTCSIKILNFENSFDLDTQDIINYLLIRSWIGDIKVIKYKLDLNSDYRYFINYFLLDFNLNIKQKEYLEKITIKIIESLAYIDKEKLKEWKIELVNETIIDASTLRTGFELDEVISKINNKVLNEKLIYFILKMRERVLTYMLI